MPAGRDPLWKQRLARLGVRTPLARTLYLGVASLFFAAISIGAIYDVSVQGPSESRVYRDWFVAVTSPAMLFYCVFLLVGSVQELWRSRR